MSFENPQPGDQPPATASVPATSASRPRRAFAPRRRSPAQGPRSRRATTPIPARSMIGRSRLARSVRIARPADGGVHFSAPFIRRPVATFLLSIAIILAGAAAYALLPGREPAAGGVPGHRRQRGLPGADPETMASAVATPLERQFSKIAGINQMTSSSVAPARPPSPCSSTSTAT